MRAVKLRKTHLKNSPLKNLDPGNFGGWVNSPPKCCKDSLQLGILFVSVEGRERRRLINFKDEVGKNKRREGATHVTTVDSFPKGVFPKETLK